MYKIDYLINGTALKWTFTSETKVDEIRKTIAKDLKVSEKLLRFFPDKSKRSVSVGVHCVVCDGHH
jgi:hypothetical protein